MQNDAQKLVLKRVLSVMRITYSVDHTVWSISRADSHSLDIAPELAAARHAAVDEQSVPGENHPQAG